MNAFCCIKFQEIERKKLGNRVVLLMIDRIKELFLLLNGRIQFVCDHIWLDLIPASGLNRYDQINPSAVLILIKE